ncbi:MAG: hypothetical protein LC687_07070, partial [Actinobacteria bacterium]|nr:hypothetical protein [Actinomycetota bacterium]
DSPTYTFVMIKPDGSDTLRQTINFMRNALKVFIGLNVTTPLNKLTLIRELMTGQALVQFNKGFNEQIAMQHALLRNQERQRSQAAGDAPDVVANNVAAVAPPGPHDDFIAAGLQALITYVAPHKALAKQKRWMRRFCRKPADITICEFANHVTRINNDELINLPPFAPGTVQCLTKDEIIDIILNGVPRSWTREMDKQDFDPVANSLTAVIHFCERMEAAEDFEPGREAQKTNTSKTNAKKAKSDKKEKSSEGGAKYCLLHGDNYSHDTNECTVLKKQADKLRRNHHDENKKPAHNNKTWKRNADQKTSASKKELAAFVRKQARKELYAFNRKRKLEDESSNDDERSVASLNNVEAAADTEDGEIDLAGFNYTDMDNLKIDSDDDVSV